MVAPAEFKANSSLTATAMSARHAWKHGRLASDAHLRWCSRRWTAASRPAASREGTTKLAFRQLHRTAQLHGGACSMWLAVKQGRHSGSTAQHQQRQRPPVRLLAHPAPISHPPAWRCRLAPAPGSAAPGRCPRMPGMAAAWHPVWCRAPHAIEAVYVGDKRHCPRLGAALDISNRHIPPLLHAPAMRALQGVARGRLRRWPLQARAWRPQGRAGSGGGAAAPLAAAAPGPPCMAAHAMGPDVEHCGHAGGKDRRAMGDTKKPQPGGQGRQGRCNRWPPHWPCCQGCKPAKGAGLHRAAGCEGRVLGGGGGGWRRCRWHNWVTMARDGSPIGRQDAVQVAMRTCSAPG